MKKDLVIFGSSGFAREVAWLIEEMNEYSCEYNVLGFIDQENIGEEINGLKVLGDDEWVENYSKHNALCGALAMGSGKLREKVYKKHENIEWPNLIHPSVKASKYNTLGIGNIVCANVVMTTNIKLGNFNVINLSCTIGHDSIIGNFTSMMPDVNISGNVKIGDHAYFGTDATVIPPVEIGENAIIGAGAVVIKNVEKDTTVVGNPARVK